MNPEDTNPKLVSFLDTLVNPLDKLDLSLNVKGIFAFPEEMMTIDENNPNFFSYSITSLGVTLSGGKVPFITPLLLNSSFPKEN